MKRVVFAILVVLGSLAAVPADAAKESPEEHCVVHVLGQAPDGEYVTSPMTCHATMDSAMEAAGVGTETSGSAAVASFTIGTHYDGFGMTGSSFSVVGDNCGGGWLNVSFFWNNKISSTFNGCPYIAHYDGYSLTGINQWTVSPGGNLSTLNNRTSSIKYFS